MFNTVDELSINNHFQWLSAELLEVNNRRKWAAPTLKVAYGRVGFWHGCWTKQFQHPLPQWQYHLHPTHHADVKILQAGHLGLSEKRVPRFDGKHHPFPHQNNHLEMNPIGQTHLPSPTKGRRSIGFKKINYNWIEYVYNICIMSIYPSIYHCIYYMYIYIVYIYICIYIMYIIVHIYIYILDS